MAKFQLHIDSDDENEFKRLVSAFANPTGLIVNAPIGAAFSVHVLKGEQPAAAYTPVPGEEETGATTARPIFAGGEPTVAPAATEEATPAKGRGSRKPKADPTPASDVTPAEQPVAEQPLKEAEPSTETEPPASPVTTTPPSDPITVPDGLTFDMLKEEMTSLLKRSTAANAQATLKGATGKTGLSQLTEAEWPTAYAALKAA